MYNIEAEIYRIESTLDRIFDKYKDNGYFENIEPSNMRALIYKNTIKFIPIEVNEEVQGLLNILNSLETEKAKSASPAARR